MCEISVSMTWRAAPWNIRVVQSRLEKTWGCWCKLSRFWRSLILKLTLFQVRAILTTRQGLSEFQRFFWPKENTYTRKEPVMELTEYFQGIGLPLEADGSAYKLMSARSAGTRIASRTKGVGVSFKKSSPATSAGDIYTVWIPRKRKGYVKPKRN